MTPERYEVFMQRCVDGELSSSERRELLRQLDTDPEGWKVLACAFMEDQLFAAAAAQAIGFPETRSRASMPVERSAATSQTSGKMSWGRWLSHPVTSVVLSLCVAFLGGLLVSGALTGARVEEAVDGRRSAGVASVEHVPAGRDDRVSGSLVSTSPNYSVRLEAEGMSPQNLPVYEDMTTFMSRFVEERQRAANQDGTVVPVDNETQIRFLKFRMDDGRIIVFPVEPSLPQVQ